MVTKKTNKKAGKKGVKTLKLKREVIKDLSGPEKKKIKGGGGVSCSVIGDRNSAEK